MARARRARTDAEKGKVMAVRPLPMRRRRHRLGQDPARDSVPAAAAMGTTPIRAASSSFRLDNLDADVLERANMWCVADICCSSSG